MTSLDVIHEQEEVEEREHRRVISANGIVQPARWGQYSFSFFGEKGNTREIAISIHENTNGEGVTLSGLNIEGDIDVSGDHYFFLELHLHQERFANLLKELSIPGAVLYFKVRSDKFRNFYAEWSPSISEGRVIKFLDRKRDVENADEIPEDFWRTPEIQRERLSDRDNPPVTISVRRPLQTLLPSTSSANDQEDKWNMIEGASASIFQPTPAPFPNLIPALNELSKRLRRGAYWISLWLALIFAILVLHA